MEADVAGLGIDPERGPNGIGARGAVRAGHLQPGPDEWGFALKGSAGIDQPPGVVNLLADLETDAFEIAAVELHLEAHRAIRDAAAPEPLLAVEDDATRRGSVAVVKTDIQTPLVAGEER